MANGLFNRYATPGRAIDQAQYDEGLRQHMLSVYNYMSIGLGVTGVVAFVTAMLAIPARLSQCADLRLAAEMGGDAGPAGFVFFLSARHPLHVESAAQMTFWAFAAVMGLSLSSIFLVFTGASIARVFFITGATFGAISL